MDGWKFLPSHCEKLIALIPQITKECVWSAVITVQYKKEEEEEAMIIAI